MKKLMFVLALACAGLVTQAAPDQEAAAWRRQAENVTIVRDDWGIAHVHGRTDADAVFGMVYAQAEDDFTRIETNYLNAMGRLAEAEGEAAIYRDLRMKIFIDPADLQAQYAASPVWLRALMDAWADGLNYYLSTHPAARPRVITRFEPWMALSFSEGSIGGDIEKVALGPLEAFYGKAPAPAVPSGVEAPEAEPSGSNGFALAPSITASKRAMLWINPHTSFFFRSELQMTSDEGLNAYGAVTWGQFFVYQGFNERAGWMHTSSSVDNIDEYLETIVRKGEGYVYRYGTEERPVVARTITVPYKTAGGTASRTFTVYRTHHGPVVRDAGGKWVSVRMMQEPLKALTQSYSRTKATSLKAFRETMALHTNSSNNTVYADADGNIAYFHSNFIPKRDPRFDWSRPVDGSDPATEWNGLLTVDESPIVLNPANGWIQNTNNWPYSASGPHSPKRERFAAYVDAGSENPRGVHAMRVLSARKDFTIDSVITAGYDSALPQFERMVPALVKAWEALPAGAPLKGKLADQIALLRAWDFRWGVASVPTALAVFWGEELWQRTAADARRAGVSVYEYMESRATAEQQLAALAAVSDQLQSDFGTWKTPWGEINRFQRLTGDIVQPFTDAGPSTPVGFTSARWGSLASFGARAYPGTKRLYGTSGNSFVAAVEFGDRVRARAVSAGGASGDPASKHFNDQAERYATGNLRDVYFYPGDLAGHTERRYHPGPLRVEVVVPASAGSQPVDGRMLLLLSTDPSGEPRFQISDGVKTQQVFGVDVDGLAPGKAAVFDAAVLGYPVASLDQVPPGTYTVQALLHRYETFRRADGHTVKLPMDRGEGQQWNRAPGNLFSTASGLVPFDSAITITMQVARGTARKAPAMPHSALHAARLARIANGLRLSELAISRDHDPRLVQP